MEQASAVPRLRQSQVASSPGVASKRPGVASNRPGVASKRPGVASNRPGVASKRPRNTCVGTRHMNYIVKGTLDEVSIGGERRNRPKLVFLLPGVAPMARPGVASKRPGVASPVHSLPEATAGVAAMAAAPASSQRRRFAAAAALSAAFSGSTTVPALAASAASSFFLSIARITAASSRLRFCCSIISL